MIRLLSICASGSPLAAKTLLLLGISGTLKDILSGSGLVAGTTVSPALTRPADQVILSFHRHTLMLLGYHVCLISTFVVHLNKLSVN